MMLQDINNVINTKSFQNWSYFLIFGKYRRLFGATSGNIAAVVLWTLLT